LPNQETSLPTETQWKYSNLALSIAGEIVAAVSGVPYPDYIHKNILEPLGMDSTSVILPEEHRDRLATGYGRRLPDGSRAVHPFSDTKGITPAANISSTVEDLAKYISLQFRDGPRKGSQVLKGSTLREMHRVHWLEPDWKSGWGLGFGVRRFEGKTLVGHGGHVGGYTSGVRFCPEDKIGVVVMSNADDGEPLSITEQVFRLVAPEIVKAVEKKEEPQPKPEWEKYVGEYRNIYGDSVVMVYNGELMIISPQADNPQEAMVKLVPEGEDTFRMECKDGGVEIGEIARFEMTPEGKVDKLWIGDSFTYRIE
jgi:CubicO group peptidase (beta-lactamase class C family)